MHRNKPKILDLIDLRLAFATSILLLLSLVSFVLQTSAGNGDIHVFAIPQMLKIGVGFLIFFVIYFTPSTGIYKSTEAIYCIFLILVVLVEVLGKIHLGAQRWLKIGGLIVVQPSELIKIAIVLITAKLLAKIPEGTEESIKHYFMPLALSLMPSLLIILQPDLGTSCIILTASIAMFFLAGLKIRYFGIGLLVTLVAAPLIWFNLYNYQQQRILTFLNPDRDPLGSGYHIIQAKIAIGSGGVTGKGYLQGTQARLNFIPEKQTDFIFALLTEEFGFVGALFLLALYLSLILYCLWLGLMSRIRFVRYAITGLTFVFFIQIFFNIGMVIGLLPVVGVPLPLISYGGTSVITVLASFALILRFSKETNDFTTVD